MNNDMIDSKLNWSQELQSWTAVSTFLGLVSYGVAAKGKATGWLTDLALLHTYVSIFLLFVCGPLHRCIDKKSVQSRGYPRAKLWDTEKKQERIVECAGDFRAIGKRRLVRNCNE